MIKPVVEPFEEERLFSFIKDIVEKKFREEQT